MSEQLDFMELAERAQQGDKKALDRLAELAASRLRVYVYRLTYQDDLAQDIVQETLLEMVKVLGKLKRTDRFLPWLYGIATNKLRHFYRSEAAHRRVNASKAETREPSESRDEGLENLLSQELKEIIASAIKGLKTSHRAVLIMRCYDGMSYAEIAESMGTSEFGTRMLFIRAKKALEKQLARSGLGRGSLLAVLVLFGRMTAPSKAAAAQITVTAATVNAGLAAGAVGLMASKAAIVSLTTAGALTVGAVALKHQPDITPMDATVIGTPLKTSIEAGNTHKHTLVWPDGPDGPIIMVAQSDDAQNHSDWEVKQTPDKNYYYSREKGHVELNNHRAWHDYVMRLPTDSPAMIDFLAEMDGFSSNIPGGVRVNGKNFVVTMVDRLDQPLELEAKRQRGVEEQEPFQKGWETDLRIEDYRDALHTRGWAYFTVEGHIHGEPLSGRGRLPLYQSTYARYSPWLKLRVGDLVLADTSSGAYAYNQSSKAIARFAATSFFKGLARPWMGLHTIDTVRRDAAELRLPFTTAVDELPAHRAHGEEHFLARVELAMDPYTVVYTINLYKDWVDRIDVFSENTVVAKMIFNYTPTLPGRDDSIASPGSTSRDSTHPELGAAWISHLVSRTLTD